MALWFTQRKLLDTLSDAEKLPTSFPPEPETRYVPAGAWDTGNPEPKNAEYSPALDLVSVLFPAGLEMVNWAPASRPPGVGLAPGPPAGRLGNAVQLPDGGK